MTDKIQEQVELEHETVGVGKIMYHNTVLTSIEKGRESETAYAQQLLRAHLEAFAKAIAEWKQPTGRGGGGGVARKAVKDEDPFHLAYRTFGVVFDGMNKSLSLASAAATVGASLEADRLSRSFNEQEPAYYNVMLRNQLKDSKNDKHVTRVVTTKAAHLEIDHNVWTTVEQRKVGVALVVLLVEHFDLFEWVEQSSTKDTRRIVMTDRLSDWVLRCNAHLEGLAPPFMPMVSPPLDWDDTGVGGYYTRGLQERAKFIRAERSGDLGCSKDVLDALNAVQGTGWRINQRVLDVQQRLGERGGSDALPEYEPQEILASPTEGIPKELLTEEQLLQLTDWKMYKRTILQLESKRKNKALQSIRMVRLAERFREEEVIYFPHNLDFRGRAYPIPLFLQPQGNDQAKSLLEFSAGLAIGDSHEALAIHGANVWGEDKCTLSERVRWVEQHQDMILSCAKDPLYCDEWLAADKPWQFLAFCFEWEGYCNEGEDWVTRLPCAYDGSCNGIQHFSAALRDEVGAAAVNLLPSEVPADIYGAVAHVVRDKLCHVATRPSETEVDKGQTPATLSVEGAGISEEAVASSVADKVYTEQEIADMLLEVGIDRKLCKRPVMILPYNGTRNAVRNYLHEGLLEKDVDLGDMMQPCLRVITSTVWEAMSEVVVAARLAMDWIAEAVRIVVSEADPDVLTWVTPAGLEVRQKYNKYKSVRLQTVMGEIRVRVNFAEDTDELDKRQHKQAASPNWVHSLDAAALMLTVNGCKAEGINDFAMIHDSYGVHAPNAAKLNRILREKFVEMYSGVSPLANLKDQWEYNYHVELPELPPMGDLDIREVLKSEYFFA